LKKRRKKREREGGFIFSDGHRGGCANFLSGGGGKGGGGQDSFLKREGNVQSCRTLPFHTLQEERKKEKIKAVGPVPLSILAEGKRGEERRSEGRHLLPNILPHGPKGKEEIFTSSLAEGKKNKRSRVRQIVSRIGKGRRKRGEGRTPIHFYPGKERKRKRGSASWRIFGGGGERRR